MTGKDCLGLKLGCAACRTRCIYGEVLEELDGEPDPEHFVPLDAFLELMEFGEEYGFVIDLNLFLHRVGRSVNVLDWEDARRRMEAMSPEDISSFMALAIEAPLRAFVRSHEWYGRMHGYCPERGVFVLEG